MKRQECGEVQQLKGDMKVVDSRDSFQWPQYNVLNVKLQLAVISCDLGIQGGTM